MNVHARIVRGPLRRPRLQDEARPTGTLLAPARRHAGARSAVAARAIPSTSAWPGIIALLALLAAIATCAVWVRAAHAAPDPGLSPAFSADGLWTGLMPSPAGRSRHVGVYDPALERMIVFGGRCLDECCLDGAVPADAWSWPVSGSGGPWIPIRPDGALPPVNLGPVGVYDSAHGRLLVMSGSTVRALGPPNAPQWSTLSPTGTPPAISLIAAIYDPVRDRMLGMSSNGRIWELTLSGTPNWTELSPTGKVPSSLRSAIYDSTRDRLVVFADSVRALTLSGPPAWSTVSRNQTTPGHSVIYDPIRDRAVVHGGSIGGDIGTTDTWTLSFGGTPTWTLVSSSGPLLAYQSAVYDPIGDRMLIFGGYALQFYVDFTSRALWAMALDGAPAWTDLTTQLAPRACVNPAVRDPVRDRMLVFDEGVQSLDLSGAPLWSTLSTSGGPPSSRSAYAAIHDPVRDRLVMFGGTSSGGGNLTDLWTLSLGGSPAWSQPGASGTPPDSAKPAVYDPVRDRMLLVGGDHVWALSLAAPMAWSELATSGAKPTGVYGSGVVYDAPRDRVLVVGGVSASGLENDVWALDLASNVWTLLAPSGGPPDPRSGAVVVFDPARDRLVLSGGDTGVAAPATDTWALSLSPSPAWHALAPDVLDQGGWTGIFDTDRDRVVTVGQCGIATTPGCVDPNPRAWALWFNPLVDVPVVPAGATLSLAQSHPNPARGPLVIPFSIERAGAVTLRVYDISGRLVRTLVAGALEAGPHAVRWDRAGDDGRRADPGIYFYELRMSDERLTRRMILLR